jgi:hypothetical protein
MKYTFGFILFFLLSLYVSGQQTGKSLQVFLKQNWRVIRATDVTDSSNVLYDEAAGIKQWNNISSYSIYPLDKKTFGFINSNGPVETGVPDSVGNDRFLGKITYIGGMECLFEYKNIIVKENQLTFTFLKWNYTRKGERLFHYGLQLVCERSKKPLAYPDWKTLEKSWGNKISFVFTTNDGKPLANELIKVSIPQKGYTSLGELYTDKEGKVTSYFPDSYFLYNNNISFFFECNGLKSSAILEKKYCPAILKRTMTVPEADDKIMVSPPDQP